METSDVFYGGTTLAASDRLVFKIIGDNSQNPDPHNITFASEGQLHYSYVDTPIGVTIPSFSTGSYYPITSSWSNNAVVLEALTPSSPAYRKCGYRSSYTNNGFISI